MKKALACALLVVIAGCGKSSSDKADPATVTSATVKASCNVISGAGSCTEYGKEDPLGLTKGLCEGFKGTYASTACPADSLVGTCAMKDDETKKYYVTKDPFASFAVDEAKKDCESDLLKGKFTPSANPPPKPAMSGDTAAGSASGAPMGSAPSIAASGAKSPAPRGTGLPGGPAKKH